MSFPFVALNLRPFLLTELKGSYLRFPEGTQHPDLRPRDEVVEAACVDNLEC